MKIDISPNADMFQDYDHTDIPTCKFRKLMVQLDSLTRIGYLVATKEGSREVSYCPIVLKEGFTEEELELELQRAEKELLIHYKKL